MKASFCFQGFYSLFIYSYTCEASNQFGRIHSSANIQIIRSSPPVIIEGPHSAEAQPGQQITFRCKARGEPKPAITWFFDGSEIPDLNGHTRVKICVKCENIQF